MMFHTVFMAAAETAYPEGGTEAAIFPPLDAQYFLPQLFWLGVTFAVLYFVLAKIFLPAIGQTLEERSSRIADDLDSAARMQRESEDANAAYEQSLRDARAKAHTVAEATRSSVDEEIAREIELADSEADKAAAIAEQRIREIRQEAMTNIDTVARDTAEAIAAKLSGKTLRAPKAS